MQISCREVRKELANYMEEDISPELRERIERHFLKCDGCSAIYDGLRKVIRLVNSTEIIQLPEGFSVRLYCRIVTSSGPESRTSQYKLTRLEHLLPSLDERADANASRTRFLARDSQAFTAPAAMPRIHAASSVSRFLTSRRKSTSRYFTGSHRTARRSASPSSLLTRAFQAMWRQSVEFR